MNAAGSCIQVQSGFYFPKLHSFFKWLVSRLLVRVVSTYIFTAKKLMERKMPFIKHRKVFILYCFAEVLYSRIIPVNNLRKYAFRHLKGKRMSNFYFINALGQNLANSEPFLVLRFLFGAKICNFRQFVKKRPCLSNSMTNLQWTQNKV